MLSETERKFLQNDIKLTGKNLVALQTRVRKKTELGIADITLVCENLEKINTTENNSWKNIDIFCKSKSL